MRSRPEARRPVPRSDPACSDVPRLTEAHEKLKTLIGNWRGTEISHPSPFDPKGGEAAGLVTNWLALDGFAVIQDYEQHRDGKTNFRGHGIFRWDGSQNSYVLHWLDSVGGPMSEMRGAFNGKVLQLVGQAPTGHSRATFDFTRDRKYAYRMEVSPDGKQWFPFMEGTTHAPTDTRSDELRRRVPILTP